MKYYIVRIFEILLSLLILITVSPILIILYIFIKINCKKVIFKQQRVGYKGNYFKIYKFVTMKDNSEIDGTITYYNDPRIIKFGRILRKFKINELPQLINIIKGEMTFIGPRPLTEECFNCYDKKIRENLIKIKPGISGIGSIVFVNEDKLLNKKCSEKNNIFYKNCIMPLKGRLEKWYIDNKTFYLDFKIFIYTLIIMVFPKSFMYLKIKSVKKIITKSVIAKFLLDV